MILAVLHPALRPTLRPALRLPEPGDWPFCRDCRMSARSTVRGEDEGTGPRGGWPSGWAPGATGWRKIGRRKIGRGRAARSGGTDAPRACHGRATGEAGGGQDMTGEPIRWTP